MSKVALIAKLSAKAGRRDDIVTNFSPMMEAVNGEAGTEVYILHLDQGDENVAWVYELYTDSDAMGAHSGSETMATLLGAMGDLIENAEMILLEPVSGKGL